MAKGIQANNGKAFEYACLKSIFDGLCSEQAVVVEETPQLRTARYSYDTMTSRFRQDLDAAAAAALRALLRLEPQLLYSGENAPLYITIQADSQGQIGDVRDVLCLRKQNGWVIGLSCKHNHHAVKHSRLSDTIDFGAEWFDAPCSNQYFSAITPIFSQLRQIRQDAQAMGADALWAEFPNKSKSCYVPILQAFMDELIRLDSDKGKCIPARLISYLVGKNDFYKVITDDLHRTTRIEAININGTLNRPAQKHLPSVNVAKLRLPNRFFHIGFRENSETTIEVVCDEGWTVSMRIHNASSRIEPSLKFDVQLLSLPSSIHAQVEPWD